MKPFLGPKTEAAFRVKGDVFLVIELCGKLSCFNLTSLTVRTPKFGIDGARLKGLDYVRVCARLCRLGTAGLLFQVGDSSR